MIRSIEIKCLRGIREGKLEELTPLVVLVGPNGSGKSTVLDASLIGASLKSGEAVGRVVARHEGLKQGGRWLFWRGGGQGDINIALTANSAATVREETRSFKIFVHEQSKESLLLRGEIQEATSAYQNMRGEFQVQISTGNQFSADNNSFPWAVVPEVRFFDPRRIEFSDPLHEMHTRSVEKGETKAVKALLQALLPDLEDLQILAEQAAPLLYLVYRNRAVPAVLAGDGIRLLLQLAFELATQRGGLVLMEEPETHLHPGAIRQAARAILASVRRGTQVIITTHSLELIDALVSECTDEDLKHFSLFRLVLEAGLLKSSRLSGADIAFARTEIEDDLR